MAKEDTGTTRREFLKTSALTATGLTVGLSPLNASVFARANGANDRIRVGFIGLGNRGTQLMHRFMANDDVEIAALCDVYEPYTLRDRSKVEERWLASAGIRCRVFSLNSGSISAKITPGSRSASARIRPQGSMIIEWP